MRKDIAKVAKKAISVVNKNLPSIYTGINIVLTLTGVYEAVTGTTEAVKLIEIKKAELGVDKLSLGQTVKATWKCYVKTAVATTGAIASSVAANNENKKRVIAATTALEAATTALDSATTAYKEYKDKVRETIGEKEEAKIRQELAEKHVTDNAKSMNDIPLDLEHSRVGLIPCHDEVTGKWLWTNSQIIDHAVSCARINATHGYWTSVGDLYDAMDIPVSEQGTLARTIGWNSEDSIHLNKWFGELPDGTRYMTIDYDYDRERDNHGNLL